MIIIPEYNRQNTLNTDVNINGANCTIGSTLGSNIVTNGTFTTDLTGWSGGANWNWQTGGWARHTAGATTALTQTGATVVAGSVYKLMYDVVGRTAGNVVASCGGVTDQSRIENITYMRYFLATATTALVFTPGTAFDGAIDNITLQLVTNGSLSVENGLTLYGNKLTFFGGTFAYPTIENIGRELVFTHVLRSATGNEVAYAFNYTTNKAVSGNDTGMLINQIDTSSPDTSLFLDCQVAGSSKTKIRNDGVFFPVQAATASAPTYTLGGIYFDITLNKLRVGGATGWETVTSV